MYSYAHHTTLGTKLTFCLLVVPRCPFLPDFLGEGWETQTRVSKGFSSYTVRSLLPPAVIYATHSTQVNLPEVQS